MVEDVPGDELAQMRGKLSEEDVPELLPEGTREEIAAKRGKVANKSNVFDVKCPDCGCDYFIPMMRAKCTVTFAGNRTMMEWPTHDQKGDSFVAGCPQCMTMYRLTAEGTVLPLGKKLLEKKK